jgi:hypothetical protein
LRRIRTLERVLAHTAKNGETPPPLALALTNLVEQTIAEITHL